MSQAQAPGSVVSTRDALRTKTQGARQLDHRGPFECTHMHACVQCHLFDYTRREIYTDLVLCQGSSHKTRSRSW